MSDSVKDAAVVRAAHRVVAAYTEMMGRIDKMAGLRGLDNEMQRLRCACEETSEEMPPSNPEKASR